MSGDGRSWLPGMTGEDVHTILAHHYDVSRDIEVTEIRSASGSTNLVSLIRISGPDGRTDAALRRYDTASPRYEPELLLMESAVRAATAEAGLIVDEVIPAVSGDDHVRAGRFACSLHRLLPGESLTWPRWPSFQRQPCVPECLGGLQALWDDRVAGTPPASLLARVPAAEWPRIGGHGDADGGAIAAVTATFVEQTRPGPRLDLAGRTNAARFGWAAEVVAGQAARWPRFCALFGRWLPRLLRWAADFDARPRPPGACWLQHGDPSPTNTFFLPRVRGWRTVSGITDFELARFASFRSDLGVAGSLRFGDTPDRAQLRRIAGGGETAVPLDLRLLERYLAGYQAMSHGQPAISGDELALGLEANVLGLALWSVQMMRAGHFSDAELAEYLATQLHRYMARRCTPPAELDRAVGRACDAADSVRQEVHVRVRPAAKALVS